ncbi:MAG: hydroxymethylglutaryl-CoA lyase [Paracoccaceae bacterium]
MSDRAVVVEVGPRDGLQNEPRIVAVDDKVRLIDLLSATGLTRIEAASFVNPARVPQMADGAGVMARIARPAGVEFSALTPNLTGYARAKAAGMTAVAVFASASEGFSRANLNCSIPESMDRFRGVSEAALAEQVKVRGYVSCVIHCPFDGPVAPAAVARVAEALAALGCHEISLGDTIGRGTPATIGAMLDAVLAVLPAPRLAAHFHDTGGRALANVRVALDKGLRVFDTSVAGLGGCPFAPGAPGNVATETVADLLAAEGLATGIDAARLAKAAAFARSLRSGHE